MNKPKPTALAADRAAVRTQHVFDFVASVSVCGDVSRKDAEALAQQFINSLERHLEKHVDPDSYFSSPDGAEVEFFGFSGEPIPDEPST